MDRKQMEEIARKRAPKRPRRLDIPDSKGTTGQDALMLILGSKQEEEKPELEKKPVILYLREGINPAHSNFTKYPNDLHTVMLDNLSKEYEGILYVYLWRQSFGYGRNYCRTSYLEILKNTLISSRKTAQRAITNLVEKRFITRAKHENGIPNVNQQGALYRVFTPHEIRARTTEEGVSLDDLPIEGIVCQTIASENIPHELSNNGIAHGMVSEDVVSQTIGHTDHTFSGHTSIASKAMPSPTIPNINTDNNSIEDKYGLSDHSQTVPPFKEDSLKDSLSPRAIISDFYKGIDQSKISKTKRERAEKSLKELIEDGFSLENIHFAVEWTLKNSKEELYDFSIIKHTIGQAMAAKKKTEAKEAKRIEAGKIAAQGRAEEELREREAARIETYKESLAAEERAKLRERAEAEIRDSGQFKEEFITNFLIEAKENEIIREQIGMKVPE